MNDKPRNESTIFAIKLKFSNEQKKKKSIFQTGEKLFSHLFQMKIEKKMSGITMQYFHTSNFSLDFFAFLQNPLLNQHIKRGI